MREATLPAARALVAPRSRTRAHWPLRGPPDMRVILEDAANVSDGESEGCGLIELQLHVFLALEVDIESVELQLEDEPDESLDGPDRAADTPLELLDILSNIIFTELSTVIKSNLSSISLGPHNPLQYKKHGHGRNTRGQGLEENRVYI